MRHDLTFGSEAHGGRWEGWRYISYYLQKASFYTLIALLYELSCETPDEVSLLCRDVGYRKN